MFYRQKEVYNFYCSKNMKNGFPLNRISYFSQLYCLMKTSNRNKMCTDELNTLSASNYFDHYLLLFITLFLEKSSNEDDSAWYVCLLSFCMKNFLSRLSQHISSIIIKLYFQLLLQFIFHVFSFDLFFFRKNSAFVFMTTYVINYVITWGGKTGNFEKG